MHRKSQCEVLIGGDDISNDVITLSGCFHAFFNVCLILARFHFALIGRNLTAQSTGATGELEAEFKFPQIPSPPRHQSALESLLAG